MSNKRPIPRVDLQPYLEPDILVIKPKDNELRMEVGVDRCRTVILDKAASLELVLSVAKQSKKIWGQSFLDTVVRNVELL